MKDSTLQRLRREAMAFFKSPDREIIQVESDEDFIAWLYKHKEPVCGSDGKLVRWVLPMVLNNQRKRKEKNLIWKPTKHERRRWAKINLK